MLGLNPAALDAVRLEGIANLPEVITRLDTTPPVIVPTVTPSPNANGWNNSAVSVSWNVTDPESGISSSTGCTTTSQTTETSGTVLTCSATNAAGLPRTVSVTIKVDMTPPALTVPASVVANAISASGAAVSYIGTASDALDPSPVVLCSPSSGSIFPIGNTSVACTATDRAGNTSSGSFVVTVKGAAAQINDLLTLVSSFNLNTLGNSLTAKLQNIQSNLSSGQTNAVCGQFAAFIGQVTDQIGQGLTVAQANQLIAAANQISALVGCSSQSGTVTKH
jgi:hypothetical protein